MYVAHKVKDIMRRPLTVRPDVSVRDTVVLMNSKGYSSAVVVDDEGRPLGIFTERDLVRVVAEGVDLSEPIKNVMTPRPVTVGAEDSLSRAVAKMIEHKIRNLPVVDSEGRLVGLVTARDVTNVFKKYKEEVGELE